MSVAKAFADFMANGFEDGVISSTKASWGGSGYSVELFDDGTYRILWDNQIGNLYVSPGLILSIPPLCDSDWDEEHGHFFENARDTMMEWFEEEKRINYNVQAVMAQQSLS